jgi:hypothetical protein
VARNLGRRREYVSGNGKLAFADYPGEALILRLAAALEADADELLLLAQKIPPQIRERVLQRPDAFRMLARLDDDALNRVLQEVDATSPDTPAQRPKTASRKK